MYYFKRNYWVDGKKDALELTISLPEDYVVPNGDVDYRCEMKISYNGYEKKMYCDGVDNIQAFCLAMKIAALTLLHHEKFRDLKIYWEDESLGLLLPIESV